MTRSPRFEALAMLDACDRDHRVELEQGRDDRLVAASLWEVSIDNDIDTLTALWGRTLFARGEFSSADAAPFVVECIGSEHRLFRKATSELLLGVDGWGDEVGRMFGRPIVPLATWVSRWSDALEFGLLFAASHDELWCSGAYDQSCVGVFRGDLLESICDLVEQRPPAYLLGPDGVIEPDDWSDDPPF